MTPDEKRGYQRGYVAGRKRLKRDRQAERRQAEYDALWNRCYIALLPAAMQVNGWRIGNKVVNSTSERVDLARRWAYEAVNNMRTAP